MAFLEVNCKVRKANVFLDVSHIVAIEEIQLTGGKKGCWICMNKDSDDEGAYQVHEEPKEIVKRIEKLKKGLS